MTGRAAVAEPAGTPPTAADVAGCCALMTAVSLPVGELVADADAACLKGCVELSSKLAKACGGLEIGLSRDLFGLFFCLHSNQAAT